MPGTALVTPSVLVMDRSAWGVRLSVSVALLLAGLGSVVPAGGVTVAVLTRVPVAAGSIVDREGEGDGAADGQVDGGRDVAAAAGRAGDAAAAAAAGRPGGAGDAGRQGVGHGGPGDGAGAGVADHDGVGGAACPAPPWCCRRSW